MPLCEHQFPDECPNHGTVKGCAHAPYVCPNGHPFPALVNAVCVSCGATVVCEPVSRGMALVADASNTMTDMETEIARLRVVVNAAAKLRDLYGWIEGKDDYVRVSTRREHFIGELFKAIEETGL